MTIAGMLIALFVLLVSFYFMGPFGVGILLIILFGLTLSTYQKTKQINDDLKQIKNKLGILNEEEKNDMDIKNNAKEYEMAIKDPEFKSKINEEIEKELENYLNEIENKDNNKGK
jgi:predicted Holliday junction resolvase-like endonuclease